MQIAMYCSHGSVYENTEPISDILKKTDNDTDFGIWNTEKYWILAIKFQKVGSVWYYIYSSLFPIVSKTYEKEQQQTKETE